MFLSNVSIKRPVFATVLMLTLVVLGITSYRRLAVDLMPDVEIPVITITTIFPGASPEAVEREVTRPIEEAVNPIAGVDHVGSNSREGVSLIFVQFDLEVDADQAAQDARTKIAAIRGQLPAGIEDPIIEKIDIGGFPIISLAVSSTSLSPRDLTTLVDKRVKPRLENIIGVGKIDLVGAVEREVNVEIKPERLEALGMGVDQVIAGLAAENIDTPIGRLTQSGTELPLRIQGKARSVPEFRSMVIAYRAGRPVTLGEVADVVDGVEEVRTLALVDGKPAVALDVLKQTGANVVGVVDTVKAMVEDIRSELPEGTTIEVVRDGSTFIRESVADVQETLIIGGLLTVLIVFLFLNSWRSTVITGLTLPISVIASFIVMNFGGMTLNTMTLMALSLAIGLLIDDAIVVRENIVRHLERGEDHFEAARNGTSEIGLAVMATTASVMAVFVPVAFMQGIVGRFFYAFGITVSFAVLVSLFVSFTLDPMLSSRWVDPDIARTGRRNPVSRVLDYFNAWFDRTADRYRAVIGWAVDHRISVVAMAFAAFAGGIAVISTLDSEFFPLMDQGEFAVTFQTAPNASIEETRDRLDHVLAELSELPEVEKTYASIGAGDAGTVRDARIVVDLKDKAERQRSQREIERDVRARLLKTPGIVGSIAEVMSMGGNQKPVQASLRGEDIGILKDSSQRLKAALYKLPGIVDLEATLEHDTPEIRLIVDRERAGDVGLNTGAIAGAVASLVGGRPVTTFEDEDGEARNVRVRLPADLRQEPRQILGLRLAVPTMSGLPALVPLGTLMRYEVGTTPSTINRMDLTREVVVSANLDGLTLGSAVAAIEEEGKKLNLPPGYTLVMSGENEAMVESFGYMFEALILAVILVYLILAALFESFVDPFSIMLSLPLSVVGMAGMLVLTGDTLNMMTMIGLIMLMGLVTKNAILLVDYTKVLRGRGFDRRRAVIEAGRTRLRPIMMTTLAMIFGMLPLALALGAGGEMRAPMARAVIGGLITSTMLTLIVVPVVYTLLDDLGAWLFRRRRHAVPEAAATALVLALALFCSASRAEAYPQPQGVTAPPAFTAGAAHSPEPGARFGGAVALERQPGAAQQGSVKVLTLEAALALAATANRDVQKAVEYQKWVQGRYLEERAAAMPRLTFTANLLRTFDNSQSKLFRRFGGFGGAGESEPSGDMPDFGEIFGGQQEIRIAQLSVTQPLYTWGQVGAAIRAARVGFKLADDQLRRFRQAVARDVSTAFYDVLLAKEMVAIAKEDQSQKERHLDETRKRHAAGTATDYDILAAEVAVENARPAVIRAENAVRVAREKLRFLLASEEEVDATGTLDVPVEPPPGYDEVLSRALANRPELAEMASQKGIYTELITISKAANKPRLDFSGSLGTRSLGLASLSSTGTTWNAGVYATVPLFDGSRTKGRVAQAQSDLTRLALDEQKLRESMALEVKVAVNAVREAQEIVTGLRGTVAQAEKLLFLAEKGYELGVTTRLEVQDAQLNLLAARGNLTRAQRDYRVARVTLDWVCGTLETR
ncbi:MAG: efflux RND transporter permease subunit [Vicinamibacterales bacterium]